MLTPAFLALITWCKLFCLERWRTCVLKAKSASTALLRQDMRALILRGRRAITLYHTQSRKGGVFCSRQVKTWLRHRRLRSFCKLPLVQSTELSVGPVTRASKADPAPRSSQKRPSNVGDHREIAMLHAPCALRSGLQLLT